MRAAVALVVAAALLSPAASFAQTGDPFSPLPQPAPEAPPVQTTPTGGGTSSDDGLESWQQILIYGGGGFLLLGIGWAIVMDARRRAPTTEAELRREQHQKEHRPHINKSKARAKSRAQRAARRKNR